MFAAMLLFAAGQLLVNFKAGMVFSPFYHYGMYSAKSPPRQSYFINLVQVNGDTLGGADFTPGQWDKIHYTLHQVISSRCDSLFYQNQISRLYKKAGLPPPPSKYFLNAGSADYRLQTYKAWLAQQLGKKDGKVEVWQSRYIYFNRQFLFQQTMDSLSATNILCH